MRSSLQLFQENIRQAQNQTVLYEYLEESLKIPLSFDDLLRFQIVYSVSAFDKLMHDVIRIGILNIFMLKRPPTLKYLAESISMAVYMELLTATIPPKEYLFEQAIIKKLKTVSYQHPDKVSEGLSYIWDEKQKWAKISNRISMDEKDVKNTLKLIIARRNTIVHEADINLSDNKRYSISKDECLSITNFLLKCGEAIVDLVLEGV